MRTPIDYPNVSPPRPGAYEVGGIYRITVGDHVYIDQCIWASMDGDAFAFKTLHEVQS